MVTDLRCRKHIFLGGEIGTYRGEDFWWCPSGNVGRVREMFRIDERITDSPLVFPSLETSEW